MKAVNYRSPDVRKAWEAEQKKRAEVIRACKDVTPVATFNDDWRDQAECRGADPTLFYPKERMNGRRRNGSYSASETVDTQEARQVCLTCPVRGECLGDALTQRERFGIRGGLTPAERRPFAATWETFSCRGCGDVFHGGPVAHNKVRNFCDACRVTNRQEAVAKSRRKHATGDPYRVGTPRGQNFQGEAAWGTSA
jgi:hypothetical protein